MNVNTNYRGISTTPSKEKLLEHKVVDDRKYIPSEYIEVAEKMETQFAEEMVKQMNQTIDETPSDDTGMAYYKSLETFERAKMMAKQNNLGLQKLVLDQIYPKRLRNETALNQYEKSKNLIHHNLPSYKILKNTDSIEIGKNNSTSQSSEQVAPRPNAEGALP